VTLLARRRVRRAHVTHSRDSDCTRFDIANDSEVDAGRRSACLAASFIMDPPTLPTRSIRDYFTRTITPADAQHRTSEHGETSYEPSAKKIRITADNGRDIALRGVQESKVKRERTEDSVGTSKGARVARKTGRAKLGLLPSVPLDVLFEV
jgi:hypothetical protein